MTCRRGARGSITVEASIVLPVFICVIMSLAMLIKLVYIHDVIQHSIDEAANELATYSYIYHVSDLKLIDESVQDGLDENSKQAEEHIRTVMNAYEIMDNAYATGSEFVREANAEVASETSFVTKAEILIQQADTLIESGQQLTRQGVDSINQLQQVLEEVCKDPKKEMESVAWMLSKGVYSDTKTAIVVPLVKYTFKKYLNNGVVGDAETRVKKLNIYNGFDGLDFYSSTFFNGDENIDIVIKYKVELPLPIKILPEIYMVQRSTARAWLNGGDGVQKEVANIWDLPNKQRGMKIEELYGGNLPYDFPGIDIYDQASKTGTSIKSINLNSKTYQEIYSLNKKLRQYVDEIKISHSLTYEDQVYELDVKKLIIVIPKDSLNDHSLSALEKITEYAEACGVELTISEL